LLVPALALVEAEARLVAGPRAWDFLFLTRGVLVLPVTEQQAVAFAGRGPGRVDIRHVVYEASLVGGLVVTCEPGDYQGHDVPLWVVPPVT